MGSMLQFKHIIKRRRAKHAEGLRGTFRKTTRHHGVGKRNKSGVGVGGEGKGEGEGEGDSAYVDVACIRGIKTSLHTVVKASASNVCKAPCAARLRAHV